MFSPVFGSWINIGRLIKDLKNADSVYQVKCLDSQFDLLLAIGSGLGLRINDWHPC